MSNYVRTEISTQAVYDYDTIRTMELGARQGPSYCGAFPDHAELQVYKVDSQEDVPGHAYMTKVPVGWYLGQGGAQEHSVYTITNGSATETQAMVDEFVAQHDARMMYAAQMQPIVLQQDAAAERRLEHSLQERNFAIGLALNGMTMATQEFIEADRQAHQNTESAQRSQ